VATDTSTPLWNSESVGQVLVRHAIVGNLTRPFFMLTSDEKGIYRKSDR